MASAARGARLALTGWIGAQAISFVAYIVLAHLVSPRGFGEFVAGSVFINFGMLFAESGMLSALINRRDRIDEAASNAFFALIVSGLLMSGLALVASPLIGIYFRGGQASQIAAAMSGWLFLRALTIVPDALLQRRLSFARRALIDPLGALVFGVVAIVACAAGDGAWGLVIGTYASEVVEVSSTWGFARFRPRLRHASIPLWRELAAFARPVLQSEILRRIAGQLDILMLGRFSGASALGQYRNGLRLAQQPIAAFVDVGGHVLLPTLARMSQDPRAVRTVVQRVLGLASTVSVPISLASIPLGVPAAVLTLGHEWRGSGHAIAGLWGLLLGGTISSVVAESLKASNRPDLLVRMHGLGLAVTAASVCGAAIPFGLIGVATAISVSQCVIAIYGYALLVPVLSLSWRDLAAEMSRPLVASGAMVAAMFGFAALVTPLDHSELPAVALTVAEALCGGLVYAALLLQIDSRRRNDLREFMRSRLGLLQRAELG